ncbi:hypothetical protein NESM_000392800 [Novymonas esmeraldas]|uniref:Uncharacterized protein n=1 Tax=Novymonas esmeraldas TaxID=1808958 RepID=A0AAW0ELW5_9TRYP
MGRAAAPATAPMRRPGLPHSRLRLACLSCGSALGTAAPCAPCAALVDSRRCRHQEADGHHDARTRASAGAARLRRALWVRMHPVERWTSLVDLGRRGAYLLERPLLPPPSSTSAVAAADSASEVLLGSADSNVRFTSESTAAHGQLCQSLPYAARLHLCLSLLLWVRCLRDVQDTLARVRLPFAKVRRPARYAVADVFPTRLSEYWVDVHTTVHTKMCHALNSTAEQIPAPHAWDAETSDTVEDAATESTVTLDGGRVLHGRHHSRRSGAALLRQVQGVTPRASADDDAAARLVGAGSPGGRQRRRRLSLRQHTALQPSTLTAASPVPVTSPARRMSPEFASDASRRLPPVQLEKEPREDDAYHGNDSRGEGCPLRQDGTSSPTPVFIHVPPPTRSTDTGDVAPAEAEELVRYCVMAHAALLTNLFVEGRVVDFSSNSSLVVAYVRWLLEELVLGQFVSVSLVADAEVAAYRPYYPPWCWRSVMVLMPPRHQRGYTSAQLRDWAVRVAQSAPCAVLVEGGADTAYVGLLMEEVRRLQRTTGDESARVVQWVPVRAATITEETALRRESRLSAEVGDAAAAASAPPFVPQRRGAEAAPSLLAACLARVAAASPSASAARDVARHGAFASAVEEALANRFYTCELLYSPTESYLSPYRFERWVLEQLPSCVRVVGVNTSPLDVLYYFPHGVFLSQKVGNAFRYRAVERTLVAKDLVPTAGSHPLRYAALQLRRLSRRWRRRGADVTSGLHAEFSQTDRTALHRATASPPPPPHASLRDGMSGAAHCTTAASATETASQALVRERAVEYLADPSKGTLLGLAAARFFRV